MKNLKDMNNTNMLKRFFTLVFVLGMGMATAWAYDFSAMAPSGQTLYYTITDANNHYVQIVAPAGSNSNGWNNYTKPIGDLTLPEVLNYNGTDYSVISFDQYAFFGCSGLTGELVIPNSVTTIGGYAFSGCSGLTSVTIGNSVTSIGGYAFQNCSGLTSVTIGNSVTTIGQYAFYGCSGLTGELVLPNSVTTIGSSAFRGCSGLTSLVFSNSLTKIDQNVFQGCSGLTSVIIPNSVTRIDNSAFSGCSSLTGELVIPNSVTFIGGYAFSQCRGLTSVEIPNSVTSIGDNAFRYCSGLTSVTINSNAIASATYTSSSSLRNVFGDQVTSYTLGPSVTTIGRYAFSGCSGLTSVEIPNSVTSIGFCAFLGCSGLTSVYYTGDIAQWCAISFDSGSSNPCVYAHNLYINNELVTELVIPNSVTTIGQYVFQGCSGLTGELVIPNSVTTIGQNAFSGCSGLTSVEIPNSVTTIGQYAFDDCSGLTSVYYIGDIAQWCAISFDSGSSNPCVYAHNLYINNELVTELVIPNSVTTIGGYAFSGCSGLTGELVIPNSVTTIGSSAFSGCSGLTGELTIPNSVTSIGYYAFYGCSGLTGELTIPNSVTTIGSSAFSGCSGLTSVEIPNSVTTIGSSAFSGCSGLTGELVIPNSVTSIGEHAFYQCNGLTEVTIGEGVRTIGGYAFWGCYRIEIVHFNAVNCTQMSTSYTYYTSHVTGSVFSNYTDRSINSIYLITIGNNVTNIPSYAFINSEITLLSLGHSVTTIGENAFSGCSNLTGSLVIPNSVTTIGQYAFNGCRGLTSVEIPNSVSTIGIYAFQGCSGLTLVDALAETPPSAESAFPYSTVETLRVPCASVEAYQSAYGWRNFANIIGVCSLDISVSVSQVAGGTVSGSGTFDFGSNCTVTASASPGYYFWYWTEDDIVVSNEANYTFSVTNDRDLVAVFSTSNPANPIQFVDANVKALCVANWDTNSDGELSYTEAAEVTNLCGVFKENAQITTFEELQYFVRLNAINRNDFMYCSNLTGTLIIPNSVKLIGNSAFSGCSGLTGSLVIPNSVTSIGRDAFRGCSGLTSVEIPSSVTSIGGEAFYGCSGLTSVYYTGDIAQWCAISFNSSSNPCTYAHNLYFNNELVTDLVIPNSVTTIGQYAFSGCSCLTSVEIPNSVTTIGDYAFYGCSGLTGSLVIPNSVTTIGSRAFQGCSGLTSVEIPNSVTSIGGYAFYGCSALAILNFNAVNCTTMYTPSEMGYYSQRGSVFQTSSNCVLNIGNEVTRIPEFAFRNLIGLTSVTIGNSVTSIGEYAFSGCSGLTMVTIGNSVANIGQEAFRNCNNLTTLHVLTEIPPSIYYNNSSSDTFNGVPWSIPVYVPCGFANTYRSTSGWSSFTNIIDACPFEVNVGINPMGAAIIEGTGTYTNMETCTLSYEAAYGYAILNWMENGEVVSTDDTYSFVVTEDHDITANFQYIEQHWPLPQGYEGNMTLTGIITIDGEEQTSDFIELAAFIGDECHGTALPINVNGQRVYFLTIMGDNADEGVALEFKLYDHQQQEELDLLCTNTVNYQHDAVYGLDEFYVLNFLNYVVITATADPAEGGTIEGAGNHFPGLEATLTATANTGYTFQNWTKNGTVVSTNAAYTFTVTEAESYVAHFTLNSYDLTVSADPTEGGSVTGGGTYNHFAECTLTATANTGYTFQNWTLNDEVVSTDAEYTFEVSGGGEYVAHFQLNSYEIAATADPAEGGTIEGTGTYNHFETCTLTATAATGYTFQNWTLEGEEVSTATELSFEVNAPAAYVAHFTLNSYEITAIANPADGGTVSGSGTYDHFASCTLTAIAAEGYQFNSWVADGTTVSTDATYTFEVSGPATITAMFDLVQTVALPNGWTWWGTSVELSSLGDDGGLSMLEESLNPNGRIIKSNSKSVQYQTALHRWMGQLTSLNNEEGYRVQTVAACTSTMVGASANPEDHPITIKPNWTWIGYPVSQSQTVVSALGNYQPSVNDVIKGQGGYATYLPDVGWMPQYFTLDPGHSYLYYSMHSESQTLVYANGRGDVPVTEPDSRHWRNDIHAFADNLCLMAVVTVDGVEQRSEELELGAFVNGECRGSARLLYIEPLDRYYAMMTVSGQDNEVVEFALIDMSHHQISTSSTTRLTFSNDAICGTYDNPYTVAFGTMTAIEEHTSSMYLYPNPINRFDTFNLVIPEDEEIVELTVVDASGAVVRRETGAIKRHAVTGLSVTGLYMVRVVCKSGIVYHGRLIVR